MQKKASHYHAFAVHDSCMIDAASDVGGYVDTFQVPTQGKIKNLTIRSTRTKDLFLDEKIRTLVVEMHSIFGECHESLASSRKLDNTDSLYLSQKYRSVLRSAANSADPDDQHMRDATLWAIFECMFLKTGDLPIALDLVNWAHECFTFCHCIAKAATEEYETGIPLDQGNFWRAVVVTLLCCRFDECVTFLRLLRGDTAGRIFIQHLESFDADWLQDETQIMKFLGWQDSLKSLLDANKFQSNRNIDFLARLLNGDDVTLSRVAETVLSEWWHLMPFYVLIRHPTAAYNTLGPVAEEVRELFKSMQQEKAVMRKPENMDDLDPFFAVFNLGDISVLQDLVANPWLSLHLVDTMFCCESYENPIFKIRNSLLETYGTMLFVNSDLWEIGASYLLQCDVDGKLRIESLICSMLIDDEDTAEKLLKLCQEHELEDARTCIINTMTNKYLRADSWASALTWALRKEQSKTLDLAVNTIVWRASEKEISQLSVIDTLGDMVLRSPSLSFLLHYYRYYTMLYFGDCQSSSQILLGLVGSQDVPSNFHSVLFGQLACILKEKDIAIPRETIFELLSFFKQYSIDHETDEDHEKERVLSLKQLLLLRLAESAVV